MIAYLKSAVGIATMLVIAALLAWGLRVDHLRAYWHDKYDVISDQAGKVLDSVRIASDNPDLEWEDTATQIDQLDASLTQWKGTAQTQSQMIDELGRDTERLRAENAELAAKVAVLNRKRAELIRRLDEDAMDPGDRADCWAQIREAEDALNQLYKEGF
ncbi:hypothetical protein KNJ79_05480 [Sphingopyxis indica]|uniref:hypothetical protein n=1 Tax=Sphingopyxis indica TaxID=436663 RepID=UPI0029390F2A|nr:hypothetical protein [Sphingopyxis indica]WOF44385.1 hypothetical protein KNJ79_05480 [Sphingopyxis indica]